MAEASSLAEKIEINLLKCGICLERFQNPRGLPCLHSFCHDCLGKWCNGKTQVLCPTCKKPTPVPESGVSGFPAHFLISNLKETVDKEILKSGKGSANDLPCTNCNLPEKEAKVRCLDCKEFFCETCHTHHNSFTAMKQHQVVSVEDLRSGKVLIPLTTRQEQNCEKHEGEAKRFYCKTCEKPICRDCIAVDHKKHKHVNLKDASKKQVTKLQVMTKQCGDVEEKCRAAIQDTEKVEENLTSAAKEATKKLQEIKQEYIQLVEGIFMKHEADVNSLEFERAKELGDIKETLQTTLSKVENACELSTKVTQIGSEYDIAFIYSTLSGSLAELGKVNAIGADEALGFLEVQATTKPEIHNVVCVIKNKRGETFREPPNTLLKPTDGTCEQESIWKQTKSFCTNVHGYHPNYASGVDYPRGIAVDPNGYIAVVGNNSQTNRCIRIFTKDGSRIDIKFSSSLYVNLSHIVITPDRRYILSDKKKILLYNSRGTELECVVDSFMHGINNIPSEPTTLAVDPIGRIIIGLKCNTISIYGEDNFRRKFTTSAQPRCLAVTSKGNIAAILSDDTLQVMDYSGKIIRAMYLPQAVNKWEPWAVCCSIQDEIYVLNRGNPLAVYKYTEDCNQCLGCVITGLHNPMDIAITEDGQQLFITEHYKHMVKVFERE